LIHWLEELDKKKAELSQRNGITLIYEEENYDFQKLLEKIKDAMKKN
jgi:hypothetical protein